ncbi:phosphotransferase [Monaibacterium marinum]|nr:phosphotransferase [Monaibacterium marinum]
MPFANPRLLRAKPAKTVLAVDSGRGPIVASFIGPESLDQRPEGVAAAHTLLTERLPAGSVPALIAYIEDAGLVITELVRGQTAADMIRRDTAHAEQGITAAAQWLSQLHNLVDRPDARHDTSGRVRAALIGASPTMSAEVSRLAKELTGVPVRHVKFHNDYKPDNLVIAGDRICAIDFRNTRYRPPNVDAAQFLTRAAIYALSVRDAGPVNRIGLPRSVTEPFDAAYGSPISTEPLTELYVLTNILLAEIKRASRPAIRRALLNRKGRHGRGLLALLSSVEATLPPQSTG